MKPPAHLKLFVLPFLIALVLYAVFYYGIEHRRHRLGPWEVTFSSDPLSFPTLIINQPNLNVTNVMIVFRQGSAAPTNSTIRFDQPQPVPFDVPAGQCVFEDLTFLPGTVALRLFGHDIQLLPRVLTIDRQEYPWQSGQIISLSTTNTSRAVP